MHSTRVNLLFTLHCYARCTAGIGAACCRLFARNGTQVVIADVDRGAGQSLAAELGDRGLYVPCDVSIEVDIANLVQTAVKEYGKIDVFHNNCGKHAVPTPQPFLLGSHEGRLAS